MNTHRAKLVGISAALIIAVSGAMAWQATSGVSAGGPCGDVFIPTTETVTVQVTDWLFFYNGEIYWEGETFEMDVADGYPLSDCEQILAWNRPLYAVVDADSPN